MELPAFMKTTKKEYQKLDKKLAPKSKTYKTIPLSFLFGGGICVFGQILVETYKSFGIKQDVCFTLASITLIVITAILTGLRLFDKIAKHAGAGTLVPITGFANSVVSPALEFKSEGLILGLGAKLFIISGPVLVYGISTSVIYGVIYFLIKSSS